MIHSDLLNSLSEDEKCMLLACINHFSNKEYDLPDIQYFRRDILKHVLQTYYNIINKKYKPEYKKMVDNINKSFKSL